MSEIHEPPLSSSFFFQAQRLGVVLKEAGIATTVFGAKDTNHTKLNDNLGLPDDPATALLFEFVGQVLRR